MNENLRRSLQLKVSPKWQVSTSTSKMSVPSGGLKEKVILLGQRNQEDKIVTDAINPKERRRKRNLSPFGNSAQEERDSHCKC